MLASWRCELSLAGFGEWQLVPVATHWTSGREPVFLWTGGSPGSWALDKLEDSTRVPSPEPPDVSRQARDVALASIPAVPSFPGPWGLFLI